MKILSLYPLVPLQKINFFFFRVFRKIFRKDIKGCKHPAKLMDRKKRNFDFDTIS